MELNPTHPGIGRIDEALKDNSFCTGTCEISVDQAELYYRLQKGRKEAQCVNLSNATTDELEKTFYGLPTCNIWKG